MVRKVTSLLFECPDRKTALIMNAALTVCAGEKIALSPQGRYLVTEIPMAKTLRASKRKTKADAR